MDIVRKVLKNGDKDEIRQRNEIRWKQLFVANAQEDEALDLVDRAMRTLATPITLSID